jgi:hypothetical protein
MPFLNTTQIVVLVVLNLTLNQTIMRLINSPSIENKPSSNKPRGFFSKMFILELKKAPKIARQLVFFENNYTYRIGFLKFRLLLQPNINNGLADIKRQQTNKKRK